MAIEELLRAFSDSRTTSPGSPDVGSLPIIVWSAWNFRVYRRTHWKQYICEPCTHMTLTDMRVIQNLTIVEPILRLGIEIQTVGAVEALSLSGA